MVNKISFENNTKRTIGIIIEPEAVNIDLPSGKPLEIELTLKTDQYDDKFSCVMEEGRMIIYECRQYEMNIFVNNELQYSTPPGRYW
jgi:hypothetical protein